ncbi:Trp biosynthesis-associated membrane protein [Micropruina sonneratiae]|uniref:Trp biosynthesis-associated membrane protein n=1 Tax=Micropruina sonneratiae TaxID=2986940 RepID=UPI00222623B1|nr:Trp biosynthesis-associated membrane protein [Micropruina sp. KQZ13P-5]MCW3157586.1 Trp biosynthesis-associated membrane protein [Micropruina sp. KQZ13P-5]
MRTTATLLLWLGCGAALLAATQPWWNAGGRTAVTGAQASGGVLALVLAAAAGAFLALFLPRIGRRIVLGLVAALAAGGVPAAYAASPATVPVAGAGDSFVATAWPWVYTVAVVLTALGAVGSAILPPPQRRPPKATPDPALDAWKALDAGDDPTQDPTDDRGRGPAGDASAERQE